MIALTSTSLADYTDGGNGGSSSATGGSNTYQWDKGTSLMWLVESYVSTASDGKIDTTKVSLGSASVDGQLKRVGAVLYTQDSTALNDCILQTEVTTNKRNDTSSGVISTSLKSSGTGFSSTTQYHLPKTTATDNVNDPFYSNQPKLGTSTAGFYILNDDLGLPTSISRSIDYATEIKGIIEDTNNSEFAKITTNALRERMGSAIFSVLGSSLHSAIIDQATAANDLTRLFPDSPEPLVQWAVVVTPVYKTSANAAYSEAFWLTNDNGTDIEAVIPQK